MACRPVLQLYEVLLLRNQNLMGFVLTTIAECDDANFPFGAFRKVLPIDAANQVMIYG